MTYQIDEIKKLYQYGFSQSDIAAKYPLLRDKKNRRFIFDKINQGNEFINDLPETIKKYGKNERALKNKINNRTHSCKLFCSFAKKECDIDNCALKCTKKYLFEKIEYGIKYSLEKRKASNKYYREICKKTKIPFCKNISEKLDTTKYYSDVPSFLLKKFNAMTEQHNRQVGFNPKTASRNAQTHDYSRLYDSF